MTETTKTESAIQAKLAEYGLKAGPETIQALKMSVSDLEASANAIRRPRSYLQEPVHVLRLRAK